MRGIVYTVLLVASWLAGIMTMLFDLNAGLLVLGISLAVYVLLLFVRKHKRNGQRRVRAFGTLLLGVSGLLIALAVATWQIAVLVFVVSVAVTFFRIVSTVGREVGPLRVRLGLVRDRRPAAPHTDVIGRV
jgi:hypothetical protein